MLETNATYRLRKSGAEGVEELYFIRRPMGGYAVSSEEKGTYVEHEEYWENALAEFKQAGFVPDLEALPEEDTAIDAFALHEGYRKKAKVLFRSLLFFLLMFVVAQVFASMDLHFAKDVAPQVLQAPIQEELKDDQLIKFSREGYQFELTPKFEYDLSAMLVHSFSYDTWYSQDNKNISIPIDLCMIWGDNIKNGIHSDWSSSFSQDQRFCWWRGRGVPISNNAISNNHIVLKDDKMLKQLEGLGVGDQVRLVGKLVDMKVTPLETGAGYADYPTSYVTSVTRDDAGAGACEIIYLEKLEIIKKHQGPMGVLRDLSLLGMLVVISSRILLKYYYKFQKARR